MGIKNKFGFTLIELVSATFLVGLLSLGFATAMLQFVIGYQETREFIKLQQEMLYAIDCIRHGYINHKINTNFPLIGLLSAQEVTISIDRRSVTIVPIDGDIGVRHWVRIGRDNRGKLILNGQYGIVRATNIQIFPSKSEYIGREEKYQISELRFENMSPSDNTISLIKITMTGKVRFREKGRKQSEAEDLLQNIRYAQFETTVFVGNTDKVLDDENDEEE